MARSSSRGRVRPAPAGRLRRRHRPAGPDRPPGALAVRRRGGVIPCLDPPGAGPVQPSRRTRSPRAPTLGTDNLGRDTLSRVIWGARAPSPWRSSPSPSPSWRRGSRWGSWRATWAGPADVLSRLIDAMLAFPGILLAIAITAALGPSLRNAIIASGDHRHPQHLPPHPGRGVAVPGARVRHWRRRPWAPPGAGSWGGTSCPTSSIP